MALAVSIYAWKIPRFPGDLSVSLWVQSFGNDALLIIMKWVSYIFDSWRAAAMVIFAGLLIWWRIGLREGLLVLIAGLISLLDRVIKLVINQPRPPASLVQVVVEETGTGFPSGHAVFSLLFLGILAYLLFSHLQKKSWKIFSLIILGLLILLVGFSRIYLGVHWLSEVLGGYLIAGIFLATLIWYDQAKLPHDKI